MKLPHALLLVPALLSTPAIGQQPALQADWVQSPVNGHWYGVDYTVRSWTDSEALAESLGGHLATIREQAEQSWIEANLGAFAAIPNGSARLWMGLYQDLSAPGYSEPGGGWKWASTETTTYTNWAPNQPDDSQGVQDYGQLDIPNAWQWDDLDGSTPGRGIVEVQGEPHEGWSWPRITATGERPTAGCLADLDGDGDLDYISPDAGTFSTIPADLDSVSIHWNDGSGQFTPGPVLPIPGEPTQAVTVDHDQDGDLDIVVACHWSESIVLLTNNGGTFAPFSIVHSGGRMESIKSADFNGDGILDLVSTEDGLLATDFAIVLFGQPGGGYSPPDYYDIGPNQISDTLATGDFDGDGDVDIAVARHQSDGIQILLNSGTGVFSPGAFLQTGLDPRSHAACDLDGDGDLDLLVPCLTADTLEVYLNNGSGAFTLSSSYATGGAPASVSFADLDGNGTQDAAVSSLDTDDLHILFNDGMANFAAHEVMSGHDSAVFGITGDIDGDHAPDLILPRHNASSVAVWINNREFDCNANGVPDAEDLAAGTSLDCNTNGIPDECDIADGTSEDCNSNGIPDSCEFGPLLATPYCFCSSGAPCGNQDSAAGCENFSGTGSPITACGSSSVSADDLVISVSNIQPHQFGLIFMGAGQIQFPFGNGQLCVGAGGIGLFRYPVRNAGSAGVISIGPGIAAHSAANFGLFGSISTGQQWNFQGWFRDPLGPCGSTFNLSNGLAVTFAP
jgi:hypothetical protein